MRSSFGAGAQTLNQAQALLHETNDHLRPALERVKNKETINLGDTK